MPEQDPQVGHADRSMAAISSFEVESSPEKTIASIKSNFVSKPLTLALPASIGPPETKMVGMFNLMLAINIPGVILSQLDKQTSASAQWALTMYSTESAIKSRDGKLYNIPE
jgi:hypothetical protein